MTSGASVCLCLLFCEQLQEYCPLRIGVQLRKVPSEESQILLANVFFHSTLGLKVRANTAVSERSLKEKTIGVYPVSGIDKCKAGPRR